MAEVASAYVSLLPSGKGFGRATDNQIGPQLDASGKTGGKRFGSAFGGVAKGLIGAALAAVTVHAAVGFLKDSISEARESQKVGAQTAAVIKSTGGAANLTAKQFGKLATAISLKTGIDDEQIQTGENMLATFTNVRNAAGKNNDIFSQATKIATDLGVATKTGTVAANLQLGKALNDPAKGMSRLTRLGVTFTDQQKAQAAALIKSGDTLGAQKIILKELSKEFGGSAAAQATAGEKLSVAFLNLKEQIGTALLPVLDKFEVLLTTRIVPALSAAIVFLQKNPKVIYAFGAALAAVVVTMVAAFVAANALEIGIAAVVAGVIYAYTHFATFRSIVDHTFNAIQTVVTTVLPYVVGYLRGQLNVVIGVFKVFSGILHGDWSRVWAGIQQIVQGVFGILRAIFSAQLAVLRAAFSVGISGLVSVAKGLGRKIRSAVGDLGGVLRDAGRAVISGLIHGITDKLGELGDKLAGVGSFIKAHKGPPSYDKVMLTPAGQQIMDGLMVGITSKLPALDSTLGDVNSSLRNGVGVPAGARFDLASNSASSRDSANVELSDESIARLIDGILTGSQRVADGTVRTVQRSAAGTRQTVGVTR